MKDLAVHYYSLLTGRILDISDKDELDSKLAAMTLTAVYKYVSLSC